MAEISPEIAAHLQAYLDAHAIETAGLLGWGMDGFVWRTNRISALKVHRFRSGYRQERDVYLRLRRHTLQRLAGFAIPTLFDYDDSCLALELSIVERPFVLDFAQAGLDVPPAEFDDPAWLKEKARIYGKDWPDVQRLLNALRQYGIFVPRCRHFEYLVATMIRRSFRGHVTAASLKPDLAE
ncbi:MAG: hypothetical protein EXS05_09730 [Planctomycetaceae bacterium]|nr:hypothetical protein [Planctomycetaceae bacterium]